jgi:short-subunit dehydrogenase
MKLSGSRILVTGASGGIGRCLAMELARRGAHLALLARDATRLDRVAREARAMGARTLCLSFDLAQRDGHAALVAHVMGELGGLDALINNAGVSRFASFTDDDAGSISNLIDVNVTGPLLLTRAVLHHFARQRAGHVVNVGSILGSIAFPHFAAYSASKYALRGFSEALRRELADTGVSVTYVAPRTTATDMNTATVRELIAASGTAIDRPRDVAARIVTALEENRKDVYLGWPERFFVRLNSMLPRLVDGALSKQARIARRMLHPATAAKPAQPSS